ncbi:MAG: hypothetical protein HDR19_03355 [Lachnospiraceae bacterium]|nr:hypothetical protein [Lachnospiraceae bacterium]
MIYAMAMATKDYMPSAVFQLETAKSKGKVDRVICYNIDKDIDDEFKEKNKALLASGQGRRKGYYVWKSYFVDRAVKSIAYGDYLIYMDAAGFYYKRSVHEIIRYMEKNNIEMIVSRRYKYLEKHWTKRDVFVYMDCDSEQYWNQYQCMSGFFVAKKTKKLEMIVNEWLKYSQDARIISDAPNTCGKDNYGGFVENRHDQSIFSLLMTKYDIMTLEEIKVPDFHRYHHTMETSIKNVKKELHKRRKKLICTYLRKKDYKGVYYTIREELENMYYIQKIRKSGFGGAAAK